MKHSIKREQSHARMSFVECENQRSLAEGESNVRATLKHMKRSFNLILILAAMLTMAQTAWATDPVTKTYAFSTRSIESNGTVLKMTDPDDNTSKTVITAESNNKFSNYGSDLQIGAGGQFTIYPNINGKVTRVELTHMGRLSIMMNGSFSMSISGMTYNGNASLTGDGDYEGEGTSKITNEDASFTFVSTDAAGINGNLSMELGGMAIMLIRSGCELKITYIPSAAPVHAHDFTYTLVGNTLTATCGGTDRLECSLTNHQISTSLTADDAFDSDPSMLFPATLTNFAPFSTETGATKGNITYVNNTTSENLGTTMPSDPGQYTASITVNAGGTGYTLTKTYNVYSYAQINNIYPQLNISTDKYASTTAAGANETVTITFTSKFGETLTTLTATGATSGSDITLTTAGANTYTFTMPAEGVNIGATFSISEDDFEESGTDEYTIKTANGWGWFCFATNYDLAPYGFSGKVVKLAGNVSSSEMAGKSGHPFKGTFDGLNFTLTFNRTAAEEFCAPFHYINGATISNLHVQGTITGGNYERLGGLVGHSEGNITINNCRVSTEISTTVSGVGFHGGIIAFWYDSSVECTITGCVYDGLIYNPSEADATTYCSGFIGNLFGSNLFVTFTDCLFAPAAYGTGKYTLGGNCFTFVYPNSDPTYNMTNCYYTSILGKRQGRPAATATVAPANLGNATTDHGMVDGYKNGFFYDGKYYTPKYGDAVVEYRFNEWNERADVTINGTNNQETGVNVVGVNITEEVGNIKSVTYNRPFNTAQAATVILPFSYICNGNEGGKFFGFKEVVYDENLHKWVCTMVEPGEEGTNNVTSLKANTPYVFMPDDATTMAFPNIVNMTDGVVTLQTTTANDGVYGGATTDAAWNFHGTYKGKSWAVASNDYGFAARSGTEAGGAATVDAGQFVRFTMGAFIKPMRCYLSYVGTEAPAPARGLTRSAAATDDLPQSITVRLVSRSGETTAIGEIDTKTGELSFDSEVWYTLDGIRLSGKPSTKGIYINNGRKIVIK